MKVGEDFNKPQSSFLVVEKDLKRIVDKLLTNPRLLKLLHYRTPDALKRPNLTAAEKLALIGNEIKIVPKIYVDKECPIYLLITFDTFRENMWNPHFRDCTITFDILCHPDHWNMGDFELRPYKIAGEIDAMLNGAKMTGIGELRFLNADELVLNDQLMGITMSYESKQSKEDVIPVDE